MNKIKGKKTVITDLIAENFVIFNHTWSRIMFATFFLPTEDWKTPKKFKPHFLFLSCDLDNLFVLLEWVLVFLWNFLLFCFHPTEGATEIYFFRKVIFFSNHSFGRSLQKVICIQPDMSFRSFKPHFGKQNSLVR